MEMSKLYTGSQGSPQKKSPISIAIFVSYDKLYIAKEIQGNLSRVYP